MKTKGVLDGLRALAMIACFVIGCAAVPARAGETSAYFKSGWFTWDETVSSKDFVREKGLLYGIGVARKDAVSALRIAERLELWGGQLDYDGHDLTGTTDVKSDTVYFGTREEVAVGVHLPAGGALSFEPFAALGHKFWIRTRSSEDWNSFYAKAGVAGELKTAQYALFLQLGTLVPWYTRTHVDLSDAGYTDVVTEPKTRLSVFAEAGVRRGSFALSLDYEGMEFGQSRKIGTRRLSGTGQGGAAIGAQAYQPESSSGFISLKLAYTF